MFPVPLDPETGEPLPGYHVAHGEPSDASPDPDDSEAWRVYLDADPEPLAEVERAALEREEDPARVRETLERARAAEAAALADFRAMGEQPARPGALADVATQYGAPMGRRDYPLESGEPVTAERVTLDAGGYDSGGAYWGTGESLWRVSGSVSGGVQYLRAGSKAAALAEAGA